jgi:hypothetical protein
MRTLPLVVSPLVLVVCLAAVSGHHTQDKKKGADRPDKKTVKALMRRKLDNSQAILEALALNDLAKAVKHADNLLNLPKEPGWKVVKTKEYERWSERFRESIEELRKAAKDKNLESAKLHYLGMTMYCFHCHTYVRDLGEIGATAPATR